MVSWDRVQIPVGNVFLAVCAEDLDRPEAFVRIPRTIEIVPFDGSRRILGIGTERLGQSDATGVYRRFFELDQRQAQCTLDGLGSSHP